MAVRYSRLTPDFLHDVVEKLVPATVKTFSTKPTDTTTDKGEAVSISLSGADVH